MDLLWVFFVSSHGEAQRCGKIVVADALVSCVGMMVRKQTEQIEVQRKSGDARERSSIPRFNPHPTEARTRSPESVTLCPRSVCLQGGKSKKEENAFLSPQERSSKRKKTTTHGHSQRRVRCVNFSPQPADATTCSPKSLASALSPAREHERIRKSEHLVTAKHMRHSDSTLGI